MLAMNWRRMPNWPKGPEEQLLVIESALRLTMLLAFIRELILCVQELMIDVCASSLVLIRLSRVYYVQRGWSNRAPTSR